MDRLTKLAAIRNPELAYLHMVEQLSTIMEKAKGDKGDSPVKYVDYFTPAEIQQIIDAVRSQIRDGEDGRDGVDGKDGKNGRDGADGITPKKGRDYFTTAEVTAIAQAAAKLVKLPLIPTAEEIHTKVIESHKGTYATIESLEELIAFLKKGGFRGGGSSGASIVPTIYNDTVTGTINSVNTVFTVANTIQSPVFCSLANSNYQAGIDYNVTGPKQITFNTAPDSSLAGQPFWLAHT